MRSLRWLALVCVAAAAVLAVVLLTWPTSSPSQAKAQAKFTDRAGLVVFEQQPSGLLGTAAPDGAHPVILKKVGALQGTDLPIASADGHYLVDNEGQLVTMGPAGPVSIGALDQPAGAQTSGNPWLNASFADGGKYVEATECYATQAGFNQSWIADLMPTAGGPDRNLGTVTDSAADPASAGAVEAVPASPQAAISPGQCFSDGGIPDKGFVIVGDVPDKALELLQPGQAPRTIITAAALDRELGLAAGTPLEMSTTPNPDGSWLAVAVTEGTPRTLAQYLATKYATVVITRAGKFVATSGLEGGNWSPDGRQMASCRSGRGRQSSVTVWTVGGATRTIELPGRHDVGCDQLLWSPDGSQLIYSAQVSTKGLTQADNQQHGWTVIDLRTGQVHNVSAPGQPAAWLPATAGAGR